MYHLVLGANLFLRKDNVSFLGPSFWIMIITLSLTFFVILIGLIIITIRNYRRTGTPGFSINKNNFVNLICTKLVLDLFMTPREVIKQNYFPSNDLL